MKKGIINIFFILLSFYCGILWCKFEYNDICLDMGGGENPGSYEICVIEK